MKSISSGDIVLRSSDNAIIQDGDALQLLLLLFIIYIERDIYINIYSYKCFYTLPSGFDSTVPLAIVFVFKAPVSQGQARRHKAQDIKNKK